MAGNITPIPYPYAPIALSGQHNVATVTVTKLTVPNGALYAVIQANGGTVKYTTDGTTPTTSIGMTLANGATLAISGYQAISQFQAISSGATLDVEYNQ